MLFGTLVAETILASVHVRAHRQAGHMDATIWSKRCKTPCEEGAVHIWVYPSIERWRAASAPIGRNPPAVLLIAKLDRLARNACFLLSVVGFYA
jgi:hypothetical protein